MYSLKNLLSKNPIQISGAAIAVVNLLLIADVVDISSDTVAALNVALVAVLGLFVSNTTVNAAKLSELDPEG